MHRSGTSMVSGMLSCMGAYMDPAWPRVSGTESLVPPGPLVRRNGYGEATAFRLLNERLLHWAGAEWDSPAEFLKLRDCGPFETRCLRAIQSATNSELRANFLNQAHHHPSVWGWKDPRNSLTLSLWLRAFPEARILHVRRQPDSVVDSLLRREQSRAHTMSPPTLGARISRLATDPSALIRGLARRIAPTGPEAAAPVPLDRERAYRLVDEYVSECVRYRALGVRYEEVHYEDILRAPRIFASQIAEFAGLIPSCESIAQAAAFVTQPQCTTTRHADATEVAPR